MTKFMDFPDEILCNIFEYLSSFDALYSFMNLNMRLNRLLSLFRRQIDLTNLSYDQFIHYIDVLLPMINKEQPLYYMKLGNVRTPGQIKLFNSLINNHSYHDCFKNVNKIVIESVRFNEFTDFVVNFLLSLSNLTSLSITAGRIPDKEHPQWTRLCVHSVLSISTLTKLSIELPSGITLSSLSQTIMLNSLKDVTLNLKLVTDLLILIKHIPNIENLSIGITWWASGDHKLVKMFEEISSNSDRVSLLSRLKSFHLTVDSVLLFQFEHLEQLLRVILNNETTNTFSFIVRNCFTHNTELTEFINGKRWENLLSTYSSLNEFNLFIRITGSFGIEEEIYQLNSFKSKYFLMKQWFFSYFKYSVGGNIIFYSIPYKNKELFDISIPDCEIFNNFPINYATSLLIDQTKNETYEFSQSDIHFILNHFPSLQEIRLYHINIDLSIINPINHISSLKILIIEKEWDINLPKLMELLPLTNTLFLPFFSIYGQNKSLE